MNQTDAGPSFPTAITVDKRAWQQLRADNEHLHEVLEDLLDACDAYLAPPDQASLLSAGKWLTDARRAGRAALRRS